MRLLILCTANSARSQMGEGWARHFAQAQHLELEVHSAGTKATRVNPNAIAAMNRVRVHSQRLASLRGDEPYDQV